AVRPATTMMSRCFFMRPRWDRLRSKARQSAIKAASLLLVGCGKLLGFDEDAEDEKRATEPPAAQDASADGSTANGSADGSITDGTLGDAATGIWRCALDTTPRPPSTTATECQMKRQAALCIRNVPTPANGSGCVLPEAGMFTPLADYCGPCTM